MAEQNYTYLFLHTQICTENQHRCPLWTVTTKKWHPIKSWLEKSVSWYPRNRIQDANQKIQSTGECGLNIIRAAVVHGAAGARLEDAADRVRRRRRDLHAAAGTGGRIGPWRPSNRPVGKKASRGRDLARPVVGSWSWRTRGDCSSAACSSAPRASRSARRERAASRWTGVRAPAAAVARCRQSRCPPPLTRRRPLPVCSQPKRRRDGEQRESESAGLTRPAEKHLGIREIDYCIKVLYNHLDQ